MNDLFEKLKDVFAAAALKYLTPVDANPKKSNQHEIGGLIKAGLGVHLPCPEDGSKTTLQATMFYLDDYSDEPVLAEDEVSWYDCRHKDVNRKPEWRLYYKRNSVTERIRETDFMLVAVTREGGVLIMFCPQGSHTEVQLRSIFGVIGIKVGTELTSAKVGTSSIVAPVRLMLAQYGIELDVPRLKDELLQKRVIKKFGSEFPSTRKFSDFARTLSKDLSAVEAPDETLLQWMNDEEHIFRMLERHIVKQRLLEGFGEDVDAFIRVSLSVQNRRKSRVGHAFENHIEECLRLNGVAYERGVRTEGKQKPDFLFPGRVAYLDSDYSESELHILGAKTTCKERWRQVLAEAARVKQKHLITMEPSVSVDQTAEMKEKGVQLVVPLPIQATYKAEQQEWLMSFKQFISLLRKTG